MGTKWTAFALMAGLLLAACGGSGGELPEPTPGDGDPIADSVQQTVAAIAVAQTVAALTTPQVTPTLAPVGDATEPPPTPEVLASPTADNSPTEPPQATTAPTDPPPTALPAAACTVVSDVNLRPGPGTVYAPAIAAMPANTQLVPLAYSSIGFPQGPWLQAQVANTGQIGWVSARPQYILCNVDYASLPLATNIPPTPTPLPTATTAVAGPPRVENDAPGGSFPEDGSVTFNIIVDPAFLFRMDVRVLSVGNFEGAGIESVGFSISGNGVDYFREERTAGFCVFGGGEPHCNPWPQNAAGQYTWGVGGPVVESGEYFVNMSVTADEPDPEFFGNWNWNFPFQVTLP